jgi:hypothetical protein
VASPRRDGAHDDGPARARAARALTTVITGSALPYGYTITVWSSGAVLIHSHGQPSLGDIFLFIAGAVAAFAGLAAAAAWLSAAPLKPPPERFEQAGTLHLFAAGAAVGLVVAIAAIPGFAAWPAASFGGTVVYLLCATAWMSLGRGDRSDQ